MNAIRQSSVWRDSRVLLRGAFVGTQFDCTEFTNYIAQISHSHWFVLLQNIIFARKSYERTTRY